MKRVGGIHGTEPTANLGRKLDPLWKAVVNHPVLIILLIGTITVVLGAFLSRLKVDPSLEALVVEDSPAKIAYRNFIDQYGSDEFLVVAARPNQGDLFTPENLARIKALSDELQALPQVVEVQSLSHTPVIRPTSDGIEVAPLYDKPPTDLNVLARLKQQATSNKFLKGSIISEDGTTCVWYAFPDLRKGDSTEMRMELYEAAKAAAEKNLPGFEIHLEGIPTVKTLMVKYIERGMVVFGTASAFFLAILLFLTFGSPRGIFLPGGVVMLAITWTLGLMGATGGVLDSVNSLLFALIMVVGVGDTVHILVHYLEEFFLGNEKKQALLLTMRRMFTPCLLTSLTTAIGFLSLVTIRIPPIQRFGLYAAIGVLAAFMISILLAPALLMLLREPSPKQQRQYSSGLLNRWLVRIGNFNQRRRFHIVLAALLILIVASVGISKIRVETQVIEFFHPWSPIVKGYRFLEKHVSPPVPMEIVFEGPEGTFKNPKVWEELEDLAEEIKTLPLIRRVDSYVDVLKELNWALNGGDEGGGKREIPPTPQAIAQFSMLFQDGDPEGFERFASHDYSKAHMTLRLLDSSSSEQAEIMTRVKQMAKKHVPQNIKWEMAGGTVVFVSAVEELTKGQIRSLAMALAVITLLIMVIFRSVTIGLLSMIPNVLPIVAMLGAMGWCDFPLDTNTVMIGPITLGIAVDDTIHYITRFRRELKKGSSMVQAMKATLTSTGRALTSTSIILAVGFSVTILSSFRPQSILGGLGALTIMMALAADLILLPVIMLLFFKEGRGSRSETAKENESA